MRFDLFLNYLNFFQLTIKEPSVSSISRRRPRSITKKRPLKGSEFASSGIDVCETEIISSADIQSKNKMEGGLTFLVIISI